MSSKSTPQSYRWHKSFLTLHLPSKLNIVFGDGRWFVNRGGKQYDTIILDAFLGEVLPFAT